MSSRTVFIISDGTGITAETLGLSLLAHFDGIKFKQVRLPFTDTLQKARDVLPRVTAAQIEDGDRPIVVMTIVNPEVRELFEKSGAMCLDLFGTFIKPLSTEFGMKPADATGMARRTATDEYHDRIDAIHFSLGHDDGVTDVGMGEADVILVGVSRSGKTPTSLYLAMQFGIRAANYPLIPEDLERMALPGELTQHREKLFGLTIDPERLHRVRNERRPGSHYASMENCRKEIRAAETLMRRESIPWLDSSSRSVEEIATMILQHKKLK